MTDNGWIEDLPERTKDYLIELLAVEHPDEVTEAFQSKFLREIKALAAAKDEQRFALQEKLHAEMDAHLSAHKDAVKEIEAGNAQRLEDMRRYQERLEGSVRSYDDRLRLALTAIEDCEEPRLTKEQIVTIRHGVGQDDNHMIEKVVQDIHHETIARIIFDHGEQRPGRKIGMEGEATGTGKAM